MSLPLIVPTPHEACPAVFCLRGEGLDPIVELCQDEFDYGCLFASLWREGKGFIIVEHDIAPWPGAIPAMQECDGTICYHEYPVGSGTWGSSLGCTKFSNDFVRSHPVDLSQLEETPWQVVDAGLWTALKGDGEHPMTIDGHLHTPPVAHIKDLGEWEGLLEEMQRVQEARAQFYEDLRRTSPEFQV